MKYYSIPEIAKILKISRIAVYKKVKSGKIKAIRMGRNYAIPSSFINKTGEKKLDQKSKKRIDAGIVRVIKEYGETLRLLGRE